MHCFKEGLQGKGGVVLKTKSTYITKGWHGIVLQTIQNNVPNQTTPSMTVVSFIDLKCILVTSMYPLCKEVLSVLQLVVRPFADSHYVPQLTEYSEISSFILLWLCDRLSKHGTFELHKKEKLMNGGYEKEK